MRNLKETLENIVKFHKNYETTTVDIIDEKSYSRSDVYHIGRSEGELLLAKRLLEQFPNL